jgi:SAM-dependent methyltransferase
LDNEQSRYDLIVSGLTFQWVNNPINTITRFFKLLKSNGYFVFSTLSDHTFQEWQKALERTGMNLQVAIIPRERLFSIPEMRFEFYTVGEDYGSGYQFLKTLKDSGAAVSVDKDSIPSGQLRHILKHFDGKVTYDLVIGHYRQS